MAAFKKAIDKLVSGLTRTRQKFVGSIRSLLSGRELNDKLLLDLEARLIEADIGVAAAASISKDLQAAYKDKRIA